MRVIISAGGTGGHIYPALSIIDKIKEKEPNSEFLYIGTHNRMEKDIVPKTGIPFKEIKIYGFYRKQLWKNFKTLNCFARSYNQCKKTIKEFKPDIVIGVGGYVTGPVVAAAHKLGVKTFIHEQNTIPGKSNKFLSKYADRIGVSFKSSSKYFPSEKVVFTGNPCSEKAINTLPSSKEEFGLSNNKKLVLCVMGSLGSSKINDFLVTTLPLFNNKEYEILYVTGKDNYEDIIKNKFPNNVKVVPYIDNLPRIMKKTDIIVSRAGASALSEIIELGLPSILIPSPYVPDNHQYKNAIDLVSNDAAILLEEKDLEGDILVRKVDELINDREKLASMKKNLKAFSMPDSSSKIYEIIRGLVDGK